jgi:decaprenylphospho-beta-D-erythro-pentofuranosid-2-ulose 2-reductase
MDKIQYKQAIILGASSDIGVALAKVMAEKGINLILASRNVDRLNPLKSSLILKHSVSIDLLEFDATDYKSHQDFIADLPNSCDLAVCMFGYLGDQKLASENWEESMKIIETNFTGAVSTLNRIAEKWIPLKRGMIVGVSSVAGERGRGSNYLYGSAKAGFTTYLDGLRNMLFQHSIHVLTVKPGFVATKMTSHLELPAKLTSSPEQVAQAIMKATEKKKDSIYVSKVWFWIMLIIKTIPEGIFKKLKL